MVRLQRLEDLATKVGNEASSHLSCETQASAIVVPDEQSIDVGCERFDPSGNPIYLSVFVHRGKLKLLSNRSANAALDEVEKDGAANANCNLHWDGVQVLSKAQL